MKGLTDLTLNKKIPIARREWENMAIIFSGTFELTAVRNLSTLIRDE